MLHSIKKIGISLLFRSSHYISDESHLLNISLSSCSETYCPRLATKSVEQGGAWCWCAAGGGACAAPGEPSAGAGRTHAPSVSGDW